MNASKTTMRHRSEVSKAVKKLVRAQFTAHGVIETLEFYYYRDKKVGKRGFVKAADGRGIFFDSRCYGGCYSPSLGDEVTVCYEVMRLKHRTGQLKAVSVELRHKPTAAVAIKKKRSHKGRATKKASAAAPAARRKPSPAATVAKPPRATAVEEPEVEVEAPRGVADEVTRIISKLGKERVGSVVKELLAKVSPRTYTDLLLLVKTVLDTAVTDTRRSDLFAKFCSALSKQSNLLLANLQVGTRKEANGSWVFQVAEGPEVEADVKPGAAERAVYEFSQQYYFFGRVLLTLCQVQFQAGMAADMARFFGLVRFLAELYNTGDLCNDIASGCLTSLLSACSGGDASSIEAVGLFLDLTGEKMDREFELRCLFSSSLRKLERLCMGDEEGAASSLRSQCSALLDRRKSGWKRLDTAPDHDVEETKV